MRLTETEFSRAADVSGAQYGSRARDAARRVLVCGEVASRAAEAEGVNKAAVSRMTTKIKAAHRDCPTCGRGFDQAGGGQ